MTLLLWRGSGKSLKYSRKTTASWIAPNSSAISSIAPLRKPNQEDHDRFSTSPHCHALLHPIALRPKPMRLATALDHATPRPIVISAGRHVHEHPPPRLRRTRACAGLEDRREPADRAVLLRAGKCRHRAGMRAGGARDRRP